MTTNERDTSGLWDTSKVGSNRTVGVSPPPRRPKRPTTQTPTSPVITTTDEVQKSPTAQERTPEDVQSTTPDPPATKPSSTDMSSEPQAKLALSLTSEQMDWLRKTASKRNLWAGELFEELFVAHKAALETQPVPRRTRRRNGNYTGTRVMIGVAAFEEFVDLAERLGTSRNALGRRVIDLAR